MLTLRQGGRVPFPQLLSEEHTCEPPRLIANLPDAPAVDPEGEQ